MVQIDFTDLVAVVAVSSALLALPVNWAMRWALFPDGTSRSLVSAHGSRGRPW
jgi:hypothetical protein